MQYIMRFSRVLVLSVVSISIFTLASSNRGYADPVITFDSRLGPGQDLYTTQGVHYNAAGAFWAVSAKAIAVSLDNGLHFTPLINGTVDLRGHFLNSTVSGGVVTGNFTTFGAGPSLDLRVTDQTGVLLAGTYGSRTINGNIGTASGNSQSTFNVDSGSLASLFPSGPFTGRMVNSLFDITPTFSTNSFASNFDGQIDGVIFSVPEPSALILGGIGSVLISLFHWRRCIVKRILPEA